MILCRCYSEVWYKHTYIKREQFYITNRTEQSLVYYLCNNMEIKHDSMSDLVVQLYLHNECLIQIVLDDKSKLYSIYHIIGVIEVFFS